MSSLSLKNLSRQFGPQKIVIEEISSEFEAGNIYWLRGKNGSGKTTLLKMLAGIILPSRGESFFSGKLSYMPAQENSFCARLNGEENLKLFSCNFSLLPQELLALTTFREALHAKYFCCSSGMKQSLSLARLLGKESDLYLLDEPTRGMDSELRNIVYKELKRLKNLGKLILITSHESLPTDLAFKERHLEGGRLA